MPLDSRAVRQRLLDLFPAPTVHALAGLDEHGTKAEAAAAVAAEGDLDRIRAFVADSFGWLHQHVYVFERDGEAANPMEAFEVPSFEQRTVGNERYYFFLLPLRYRVALDEPLEWQALNFAWPVKLVLAPDHIRLHVTIMAKTPSAYVEDGRRVIRASQEPSEAELLRDCVIPRGRPVDLNQGIKALWAEDLYDAPSVQYKRELSTSKDVMDENFTVKRHDPERYEELVDKPLLNTSFWFTIPDPCIEYFVADPSEGKMVFRRFPDSNDCVDDVVRRILEVN